MGPHRGIVVVLLCVASLAHCVEPDASPSQNQDASEVENRLDSLETVTKPYSEEDSGTSIGSSGSTASEGDIGVEPVEAGATESEEHSSPVKRAIEDDEDYEDFDDEDDDDDYEEDEDDNEEGDIVKRSPDDDEDEDDFNDDDDDEDDDDDVDEYDEEDDEDEEFFSRKKRADDDEDGDFEEYILREVTKIRNIADMILEELWSLLFFLL